MSGANPSCRARKWRFVPQQNAKKRETGNAPDSLPVFLRIVSVTKEMVRVCCWTINFDKLVAFSALQRLGSGLYGPGCDESGRAAGRTAAPPSPLLCG
ncbi:hypothetical protein P7H21_17135 [Paenibacillus larvae]|nr:hypothetical protein [Paenibacillus larvae]MDT2305328.1 hypothetical protein [Paenibacillus larvae]